MSKKKSAESFPGAVEDDDHTVCNTELDPFILAQGALRAGLISQDALDHLTSLQPEVPKSMKLRYLLLRMCGIVNMDEQLFTRMVQTFLKSQSHTATATTSPGNFPFRAEHIPSLAEHLVPYAYEWRSIGTAMKFKPQDLNTIQASCLPTPMAEMKSCLLRILEDWIQRKHKHTVEPTLNNLVGVLNSHLVGLGVVA